jgi:hypothetical protein
LVLGCGGNGAEPARPETKPGRVVSFVYGTTQGDELSSATTRGRATAIVFVTTYDLASQVQAKQLNQILHSQTPRINVGAVVLETAEYATLADVFRTSLKLSYPVAMADPDTLAGRGPFGSIRSIPTTVVLDRSGRELWRKEGPAEPREIEEQLASAARSGSAWSP